MSKPVVVDFLNWTNAVWQDELNTAVQDYLRRSREEITPEEEWRLLNEAMLGRTDLLFFVMLDDAEEHVLGFAVLNLLPGTKSTGPMVNVWQSYVRPGRARLGDLFVDAYALIGEWALARGAKRLCMTTRRAGKGYARILNSLGFTPYATTYMRGVLTNESVPSRTNDRPDEERIRGVAQAGDARPAGPGHHSGEPDARQSGATRKLGRYTRPVRR